jgi:hypothetical protein
VAPRRCPGRPFGRERNTIGRGVFVSLALSTGEAFQFDWSEDWAIAGERTGLQVSHFKLSYRRAFILRVYPQQTHEMLFDAHNHAFRVLGGIPRRGIYENMRTAVDRIGRGKERRVSERLSAMVSHFPFEAEFCNGNPLASRLVGRVDFSKIEATISRTQPLFDRLSAFGSLYGQYAFDPPLAPGQSGYGGQYFGRAFYPSELLISVSCSGSFQRSASRAAQAPTKIALSCGGPATRPSRRRGRQSSFTLRK